MIIIIKSQRQQLIILIFQKEDINTDVDAKLDYVVQLTTRVKNTFKGYGNNNIYWLQSGAAFTQTDFTRERETLGKPQAELRYYVKTQQFKLYIDGMSTERRSCFFKCSKRKCSISSTGIF